MSRQAFIVVLLFVFPLFASAQHKAILLKTLWNNDLDNYNPKEYLDQLYDIFKQKLAVSEWVIDPKAMSTSHKDIDWDKNVQNQLSEKKAASGYYYYVAMANELRLPTFNLGKLLFKNPPRTSKLTLTFHVYDTSGNEVLGDTIINRGCLVKAIDVGKDTRNFYSDYNSFISDLRCHLDYIRAVIREKPLKGPPPHQLKTKQ